MTEIATPIDEAITWHLKLPGLSDAEWPDFVGWLERSPANRAAYDEVVRAEAAAAEGLALTPRIPVFSGEHRFRHGRGYLRYAAALAAGVAILAGWTLWPQGQGVQIERTAPGATKQLAFADGTHIDLNGDSALAVDQASPRAVRLDGGEARFSVRHAAEPFTVEAGGFAIRDLGTVFDVQLTPSTLELDVAEGSVLFDPGGANLTLAAGERITVDRARNVVVKRQGNAAGDWLRGEFIFDGTPLPQVLEAIHRRYGTDITLSEGLSARTFTGNIRLSGNAAADVAHLAGLMGAQYRREGEAWVITDATGRGGTGAAAQRSAGPGA